MKIVRTKLEDCLVIEPNIFGDERGFFLESFNVLRYADLAGIDLPFFQDNHSRSSEGVLRGLHFQKKKPQGKLVRVVRGEVFDVAVDLRGGSKTYGQLHSVILSETNQKQFWVPPGFAHGFLVLSEIADFEYKCTEYYNPNDEGCLLWNDPQLAIDWPLRSPVLSEKDACAKSLQELQI